MINPKDIIESIKAGLISTIIGIIFFIGGGIMVYVTYKDTHALEWASVEVGLFVIGALFLKANDEWITNKFKK